SVVLSLSTDAEVVRARRSVSAARTRLARNRRLMVSVDRGAVLSLEACAEGAVPRATGFAAQRTAREAPPRSTEEAAAATQAAGGPSMLEYTLSIISLMGLKSARRSVRRTSLWAGTAVGVRRSAGVAAGAWMAGPGLPTFLAWAPRVPLLLLLPLAEAAALPL